MAEISSYIPRNLQLFIKRINDFSISSFKLIPHNNVSITAGNSLEISAPKNSLVDFSSFTMHGNLTINTTASHLPPAECFISRLDVNIEGQSIDTCQYYGDLYQRMCDVSCSTAQARQRYINNLGPRPTYVQTSHVNTTDLLREGQANLSALVPTLNTNATAATPWAGTAVGTAIAAMIAQLKTDVCAKFNVTAPAATAATGLFVTEFNTANHPADAADMLTFNTAVLAEYAALYALIGTSIPATCPNMPLAFNVATSEATFGITLPTLLNTLTSIYNFLMSIPGDTVIRHIPQYIAAAGTKHFTISNWLGALGSLGVIDTSLTGEIVPRITFAPNTILGSVDGTYTISDIYFTCDVLDFSDYSRSLYSTLSENIPLTYRFKRYINHQFNNTAAAETLSYSIASSALKRVWLAHKVTAYTTRAVLTTGNHTPNYYVSVRDGSTGFYMQVDNARYPNYDMDIENYGMYHLLKAINQQNNNQFDSMIESQNDFDVRKFLMCWSFTGNFGDEDPMCGKNTMGAASNIQITNTTAWGNAGVVNVFNECEAILNVYPGRVIVVTH